MPPKPRRKRTPRGPRAVAATVAGAGAGAAVAAAAPKQLEPEPETMPLATQALSCLKKDYKTAKESTAMAFFIGGRVGCAEAKMGSAS